MSARAGDSAASSIERIRAGLMGPELVKPDQGTYNGAASGDRDHTCPVCNRNHSPALEDDGYDEDYDYYWGDIRLPLWIALIWQVPWRQRLDIFVIGFTIGLIIAGIAVFWGLLLAQY